MPRVLAVDFGEKRVGLALSDPTATLAQPFGTLGRRAGKRAPISTLLTIIEENEVGRIVVGLPLALDASDTEWTTEVRGFAARLAERSGRPVYLLDERLTSVMAERAVRSLGLPRHERERKERVDTAAATIILQTFLDREKLGVEEERAGPARPESAEAGNGAG
ncbi:MAG: Holliday junction resolvase RuvX [Gemmatimonadota bacterium]|jgi:putative Holliday junction resolvase